MIKKLSVQDKETNQTEQVPLGWDAHPPLYSKLEDFYTGELTAASFGKTPISYEHEVFLILKGLKEMLAKEGLSLRNIFYIVAYITDMQKYAAFNAGYTKLINFLNPPSRVCIELAGQECGVKIVAKGSRSAVRTCTHVQSISSWAPANIGPYSQAYKVGGALHLAGGIALDPMSMQLVEPALPRILANISAVAALSGARLENPATCFAYYREERPEIPEVYNALCVKTTNLPKNAGLELEFHLEENLPAMERIQEEIGGVGFTALLDYRRTDELLYLIMHAYLSEVHRPEEVLEALRERLRVYFDGITHKSPVRSEDLLGQAGLSFTLEDYVTDVRVYYPTPLDFKVSWLKNVPAVFVTSETRALYVEMKDLQQLHSHQFINSGD